MQARVTVFIIKLPMSVSTTTNDTAVAARQVSRLHNKSTVEHYIYNKTS